RGVAMIRRMLLPALLCSAMGFAVNGQGTLPQRERDELAKIIRACSSGLPTEIVQASSPVAGRVGDDYWASYNAALKQQGLPSLGELIGTPRTDTPRTIANAHQYRRSIRCGDWLSSGVAQARRERSRRKAERLSGSVAHGRGTATAVALGRSID